MMLNLTSSPFRSIRLSVANAAIFLAAGCGVAFALSAALGGEATWSVSTGVGAALAAAVYEIGRPKRLSGAQAAALDEQWADFKAFADARLARKGRCHGSEIELAYRRYSSAYNARRRKQIIELSKKEPRHVVASRFGISQARVSQIVNGK